MLYLFCLFNYLASLFLTKRFCNATFIVWITGFNIHRTYFLEKVTLLFAHFLIEPTQFGQSFMLMDVRWHVITRCRPVSLEHLFYDLMTHESRIEPSVALTKELCEIEVVSHNIEPVLHLFFSCHCYGLLLIIRANILFFLYSNAFRGQKGLRN